MLDHLGDLLRTQVLKKEKELIDKQIEEAEKLAGEQCFLILAHKICMMIVLMQMIHCFYFHEVKTTRGLHTLRKSKTE